MNKTTLQGELWPLASQEKELINQHIQRHRKLWYGSLVAIFIFGVIVPFGLFFILDYAIKPESYYKERGLATPAEFSLLSAIIVSSLVVLLLFVISLKTVYIPLVNYKRDYKRNRKLKITAQITRKQYVSINQSFYLHISDHKTPSIEVNAHDYQRVQQGDDVYLFYTPLSALYLGYHFKT